MNIKDQEMEQQDGKKEDQREKELVDELHEMADNGNMQTQIASGKPEQTKVKIDVQKSALSSKNLKNAKNKKKGKNKRTSASQLLVIQKAPKQEALPKMKLKETKEIFTQYDRVLQEQKLQKAKEEKREESSSPNIT